MSSRRLKHAIQALSALGEPQRLRLFELVSNSADPLTRDQAAEALGLKRGITSFHLDKLVDEGLLEAEFRRIGDRTGPGAGRPAKFYKRSSEELEASAPERHYDTAAQLLAEGIERAAADGVAVDEGVRRAARSYGAGLASELQALGDPVSTEHVCELIEEHGYEPAVQGEDIVLRNCPFHRLARRHTELVCHMNLAIFTALDEATDDVALSPRLEPEVGRCCVKLHAPAGDA